MGVLPKRILLGVTGSIAAYKSAELIRCLRQKGSDVQVVMSDTAEHFITALSLQTLSHHPVHKSLWDGQSGFGMDHIALARWPSVVVIAPASAHHIAKLAMGLADDLLTTLCLATTAPIVIAPAMNPVMWQQETTQAHIALLKKRGIHILGPVEGKHACDEEGLGRMMEPEGLVESLSHLFAPKIPLNILITAGPTQEPIDPIRFLSNQSSGKMGFALAEAAALKVDKVTLVSGPVNLMTPGKVLRIDLHTAEEMLQAVMREITTHHIFISCAAVADYAVQGIAPHKIKKQSAPLTLTFKKNQDILFAVSKLPQRPFLVGFAAETEAVLQNAKKKLIGKNLDMIVANRVGPGRGFQSDYNEVTLLWAHGKKKFPRMHKQELAHSLIDCILERYATVRDSS
ncbi:MAG: bifunctional phosphopantothenoylcysteine decarboxylase/phosphopantothenate--cysteine ligase CoaBC [Gammaproteobacteria bacterium]|nr:bifunctional phosphopantothenoylcysteine decarboxylase/phosphopantothenate--cysteine ligase CoaBC [Gammaproteobacteria bacterium]